MISRAEIRARLRKLSDLERVALVGALAFAVMLATLGGVLLALYLWLGFIP